MTTSPYTRFVFACLIPGAALACAILFLVDVPTDEGYRISLLEWGIDSDVVFAYVVAIGLVAAAVLGTLTQALRLLLVDGWALPRGARGPAPEAAGPAAVSGEGGGNPGPASASPAAATPARPRTLGPLSEMCGNLAIMLLLTVIWVSVKIVRGGGTEIFPGRIVYGVPLGGLAACALLFAAYRSGSIDI